MRMFCYSSTCISRCSSVMKTCLCFCSTLFLSFTMDSWWLMVVVEFNVSGESITVTNLASKSPFKMAIMSLWHIPSYPWVFPYFLTQEDTLYNFYIPDLKSTISPRSPSFSAEWYLETKIFRLYVLLPTGRPSLLGLFSGQSEETCLCLCVCACMCVHRDTFNSNLTYSISPLSPYSIFSSPFSSSEALGSQHQCIIG